MDYSCIVFDTAPTGHTLRLLQFPTTLQKGLSKLMSLKGMFGGVLNQLGSLLGGGGDDVQGQLLGKLEQLKVMHAHCSTLAQQFKVMHAHCSSVVQQFKVMHGHHDRVRRQDQDNACLQ